MLKSRNKLVFLLQPITNWRRCETLASSTNNVDRQEPQIIRWSSPWKTSNAKEFSEMLTLLKEGRRSPHLECLRYATFFAWRTHRQRQFVDVIEEWFAQARPLFDQEPFKVTSVIEALGVLNNVTHGDVTRRLSWSPIVYFMRRLTEIGFNRFHAEDVGGCFVGLKNLRFHSRPSFEFTREAMPQFLDKFLEYILAKQSSDIDWNSAVRYMAPSVLFSLCQLSRIPPSSRQLLRRLNDMSVTGFQQLITDGVDRFDLVSYTSSRAYRYAGAWIQWNMDPDQIVPQSWRNWYRVCGLALANRSEQSGLFDYYSSIVTVAVKYNEIDCFWVVFDKWACAVMDFCSNVASCNENVVGENVANELSQIVYAAGELVRRTPPDYVAGRRPEFRKLIPTVTATIIGRGVTSSTFSYLTRVLVGLRDYKECIDGNFVVSDDLYQFVLEWCQTRNNLGVETNISTQCATILFLFLTIDEDVAPPPQLCHQLSEIFVGGLDRVEDVHLGKCLAYFSDVSAKWNLNLDTISGRGTWNDYFDKVIYLLEQLWPLNMDKVKLRHTELFLKSIANLLSDLRLKDQASKMKNIYERRLFSIVDRMSPKTALAIAVKLKHVNKMCGVGFSTDLIADLETRAKL